MVGADRWRFPAKRWPALVGVAAVALAGVVLLAVDPGGWFGRTDEAIGRWFVARRTSGWTSVFRVITDLGDGLLLTPLGVAVVLLLVGRPPRAWAAAGAFVAANLSATTLNRVVKAIVDRPRPPEADHLVFVDSPSFPSGHAAQAAAFWGGLAILVLLSDRSTRQKIAAFLGAAVLVVAVGVSRVYLGVHWASDVVASCLMTTAWFALLAAIATSGSVGLRSARSGGEGPPR
ncbi:MAG TPA: phosphatase PAP2 family protein [Acidimicrobiia bacterium]|nr:phosphatase PAP2 family protein [Acidimicrobiia bacterium]